MTNKCIVCDLDNTLLDTHFILRNILKIGLKEDEKWEYFYKECNSDKVTVYSDIKGYLKFMVLQGILPILSTARNERVREDTEKKLKKENIPFYKMYMRSEGDLRPSSEVKKEHLLDIKKNYDIILFIDDDSSNVCMAEELGIKAMKVPRKSILKREGEKI